MTGPHLHPRQRPVNLAQSKIKVAFWEAVDEVGSDLTYVELLQAVISLQESIAQDMLRIERHGNVDKPAGWE